MPSSSETPVLTPEQEKAATLHEYCRLQWECVLELFGPPSNFDRLLSLQRTMNAMERRDPKLKRQYFLPACPNPGSVQ
jgi:hypothetical protein